MARSITDYLLSLPQPPPANPISGELVTETDFHVTAENTESIHMCKMCGCLWRLWKKDMGWSLADRHQEPGKCCDNSVEFISQLVPAPAATGELPPSVLVDATTNLCTIVEKLYSGLEIVAVVPSELRNAVDRAKVVAGSLSQPDPKGGEQ